MRPLLINQALRALLLILLGSSLPSTSATCRTFCSNLTVDYPLTTSPGCGHPAFKEVLFCINGALMLHSSSNSYRVSAIDYASSILTIQDPASAPPTCSSNTKPWRSESGGSLGFMVDEWHEGFMWVEPENVFLLLGCGAKSKVFQGFPERRMACREGAGCEAVYSRCGVEYGGCCAVGGSEVGRRGMNVSGWGCEGYGSVYRVGPVKEGVEGGWGMGIRVGFGVNGRGGVGSSLSSSSSSLSSSFDCRRCRDSGGECGYEEVKGEERCLCGEWNSTIDCDIGRSFAGNSCWSPTMLNTFTGVLIGFVLWSCHI